MAPPLKSPVILLDMEFQVGKPNVNMGVSKGNPMNQKPRPHGPNKSAKRLPMSSHAGGVEILTSDVKSSLYIYFGLHLFFLEGSVCSLGF